MAGPIPFLGRLHPTEYLALAFSFVLGALELVVRTVTLLLPRPVIGFFYRISRSAFNSLSSPYSRRARNRKKAVSSPIAQAQDFVDLCALSGYVAEEHIVQTTDGYLLGVHRLTWPRGQEEPPRDAGPPPSKPVVYMHHGLLMNSEVWVCLTERERCLPFLLVDRGYDVWLGNNRGNKYSKKNMRLAPTDVAFWNFSMDQFAFHDIPDTIQYILSTTGRSSLSYIGFSQGTAQAFAALSINPTLNAKVDVFVALAPAMAPPGLASGTVSSLVKSNPEVLFLLFGRRAILGSATMWQALLYPALFAWFIDRSLRFLFGWRTANIPLHQKLAAYPHLYSFTSTKSVVHWFQIIDKGTFQMFDDEVSTPLSLRQGSKYYKVAKFPTRNIRTPIVLVYGGSDSLVDIKLMLKELPKHTVARCIPKYEHLDFLWAGDVDKHVFPHVLDALDSHAAPPHTKAEALGWHPMNTDHDLVSLPSASNGSQPPGYSEDETVRGAAMATLDFADEDDLRPSTAEETTEQMDETDEDEDYEGGAPTRGTRTLDRFLPASRSAEAHGAHAHHLSTPPAVDGANRWVRSSTPSASSFSPSSSTTMATTISSRTTLRTETQTPSRTGSRANAQIEEYRRPQRRGRGWDDRTFTGALDWRTAFERAHESRAEREPEQEGQEGENARRIRPEGWWSSTESIADRTTT